LTQGTRISSSKFKRSRLATKRHARTLLGWPGVLGVSGWLLGVAYKNNGGFDDCTIIKSNLYILLSRITYPFFFAKNLLVTSPPKISLERVKPFHSIARAPRPLHCTYRKPSEYYNQQPSVLFFSFVVSIQPSLKGLPSAFQFCFKTRLPRSSGRTGIHLKFRESIRTCQAK